MVQEEEKELQKEQEEVDDQVEQEEESEEEEAVEQGQMELPPVNFETFIFSLYNTARFHLGVRDPDTGEMIQNLAVARHTIDTLGMLQEKTKGNLTAPENNLMENLLYELRMSYMRMSKQDDGPEVESEAQEASDESSG